MPFGLLKIENYKETPFTMWSCQAPLGLIIEFDLSGEYLNELFLDFFTYKIMNQQLVLDGKCIADDPQMDVAKKNHPDYKNLSAYKDAYLLQNPTKNHITYRCYTSYVHKVLANYKAICPNGNVSYINEDHSGDNRRVVTNVIRLGLARTIGVGGLFDLEPILKDKIPQGSLLFNQEFWLNAESQLEKLAKPEGFSFCRERKTKQICLCK